MTAPIHQPRPPRHHPVRIAPDTWVIQATHGEGVNPLAVHMNSMVICGREPVVVDAGCPTNSERYLEDVFSIVEPRDVRWIFLSHEDVDHWGNLDPLLQACPSAIVVGSWYVWERMSSVGGPTDPRRWRWVGNGETFDVGDRVLHAIRPPVYDSPATRGLWDPTTGVYWAADAYGCPVERGTEFVADLDPEFWDPMFGVMQQWSNPWLSVVDRTAFHRTCAVIEALEPRAIATAHGPTIGEGSVQAAFNLMRACPDAASPPQPDQSVLNQIVSAMSVAA
jgi:flavorubredoxin